MDKAIFLFLLAIISVLSFPYFNKAGKAGEWFYISANFLFGKALYFIPVLLVIAGIIFLKTKKRGKNLAMLVAILVSLTGISGLLAVKDYSLISCSWFCQENNIGSRLAQLFNGFFGSIVANIVFGATILVGGLIFLQFVWQEIQQEKEKKKEDKKTAVLSKKEEENIKIKGVLPDVSKLQEKRGRLCLKKKAQKSRKRLS
jgi:uncharacterized membrane protein